MYTILRASSGKGDSGEALPVVFPRLEAATARFRRGQITLIAAAPGVGKSALSLRLLVGLPETPSLYLSGDTDAFSMALRMAAMVTKHSVRDVENQYDIGHGQFYNSHLEKFQHVRFDFSATISPDFIEEQFTAYALTYGEYPHVLVVDNLSNMDMGHGDNGDNGYAALERSLDFLHELARNTGTAVICLHHLTGQFDDGDTAPPLSSLRGKVSKVPEMVLTLFRTGTTDFPGLGVAIVKNRNGKNDTKGGLYVNLDWDPERMQLNG